MNDSIIRIQGLYLSTFIIKKTMKQKLIAAAIFI